MLRLAMLLACGLFGCSDNNPPPPSPSQKVACDTLEFCKLSSSGFSCDGDKLSACGQCINATSCAALSAGACKPDCPGVSFKPK